MIFINLDSFQLPSGEKEREGQTEKGRQGVRKLLDIRFRRPGYEGFSWGSES